MLAAGVIVLAAWGSAARLVVGWDESEYLAAMGQLGDTFGSLTAVMASIAAFFTWRTWQTQHDELAETRGQFAKQLMLQEEAAALQRGQLEELRQQHRSDLELARLGALLTAKIACRDIAAEKLERLEAVKLGPGAAREAFVPREEAKAAVTRLNEDILSVEARLAALGGPTPQR